MYSGKVPFHEILSSVKDHTGIENISVLQDKIRRFVFDAEREIGYSGTIIEKTIEYSIAKGNFDKNKFKLPDDFIEFVGINNVLNEDYFNNSQYVFTKKYIFLKNKNTYDKIYLTYMQAEIDEEGNPTTIYNHLQAVIAYIVYMLYLPTYFKGQHGAAYNKKKEYENEWIERLLEARGDDAMVNNSKEHEETGNILRMSSVDMLLSDKTLDNFIIEEEIDISDIDIYYKKTEITSNLPYISDINQLDAIDKEKLSVFTNGKIIQLNSIGKLLLVMKGNNQYTIKDQLENDITSLFDYNYNNNLDLTEYLTKDILSFTNLTIKIS